MDNKHKKAQEVYKQYQQEDPDEGVYCMVVYEIQKSVRGGLVLKEVVENMTRGCSRDEPKRVISVLEAIYKTLQQVKLGDVILNDYNNQSVSVDQREIESLFSHAVKVMHAAVKDRFEDTTNLLQECYPDIFTEGSPDSSLECTSMLGESTSSISEEVQISGAGAISTDSPSIDE